MKRLLSIFGVLFSCTTIEPLTNEINCFDQIDEDLDGTIDCADTDCSEEPNCQPTFEISLLG